MNLIICVLQTPHRKHTIAFIDSKQCHIMQNVMTVENGENACSLFVITLMIMVAIKWTTSTIV
jgi:hypothetical protein